MTKNKKRIVTDDRQMNILDAIQRNQERRESTRLGRFNVTAQLVAAMREAIRKAPKSREVIAEEMTELLGEKVTETTINNWTAPSHPHEISAGRLGVFCRVTGDMEPMRIVAETSGLYTLPGPDALRADKQKRLETIKEKQKEVKEIDLMIRALEGKGNNHNPSKHPNINSPQPPL